MSVPIPAPRQNQPPDLKKPVPTPRKTAPKVKPDSPDEQSNTFSRRVRSLSNASKQIAGDIGGLVQDKKKAVIEGTRQSVRRITKRFNSYHQEVPPGPESEPDDFSDTLDIFNSISFQSPLSCNSSIYNNVDDEFSAPPPAHPPPPLPQDVIYDAPPSVSGSTSNSEHSNVGSYQNYESVFPVYSNSDSDLSRSGSWKFYDPVSKVENIYNDVEIVKDESRSFDVNSNVSDLSIEIRNSLYENHTIVAKPRQEPEPKCRESVILQFDPLSRTQPPKEGELTNDVSDRPRDWPIFENLSFHWSILLLSNLTFIFRNLSKQSVFIFTTPLIIKFSRFSGAACHKIQTNKHSYL
jgi:hypothetical protein